MNVSEDIAKVVIIVLITSQENPTITNDNNTVPFTKNIYRSVCTNYVRYVTAFSPGLKFKLDELLYDYAMRTNNDSTET